MTELSQKPGEDRRRVVERYRRARDQIMGALIFRPEESDSAFGGVGILCLVLALIIELPYFGWNGVDRIRPYILGVSGGWPLGLLVLSMVIQACWLFTIVGRNDQQLRADGVKAALLFSAPLLGWHLGRLRMQRLGRQVICSRDRESSEGINGLCNELSWFLPSERAWISWTALGLPFLASVWGILWLVLSSGTTGWSILPIGLLLTALHGTAALEISEYLRYQLRTSGKLPYRFGAIVGLWAWFPAPLALATLMILILYEARSSRELLLVHRWLLGSSSVAQFLGASSRLGEAVKRPKTKGSTRLAGEVGSFCRLQNLRLFFEGQVAGCLAAPFFLDHIPWEYLVYALSVALLLLPLTRIARRLYELVARARIKLRRFLIIPRLGEVVELFVLGLLWGAFLWTPPAPSSSQLLLMSTALSGTFFGLGVMLTGISPSGEQMAVASWGLFGFLFFVTCAISPLWGHSMYFEIPISHLLLYLAAFVVAGGFAVALSFVPWLLKPARWQDVWNSEIPVRRRLRVLGTVVVVALPFSGLLNPLWQSKIDHKIWPVTPKRT